MWKVFAEGEIFVETLRRKHGQVLSHLYVHALTIINVPK